MRYLLALLVVFVLFTSCKSKTTRTSKTKASRTLKINKTTKPSNEALAIVDYAKTFNGTRYKYGGTNKRGMDCSGLVFTSYQKHNINLPRTTKDLATTGNWVDLKNVTIGDLVFFATKKNSRKVNHVGIVTDVRSGNVEFIHASSSKGVMISSIAERYWYFAFVQARRIL